MNRLLTKVRRSLCASCARLPALSVGLLCVQAAAAPTVSSFSPSFGSPGDPTTITINGSGFSPGALVVKFNGVQDLTAGATSTTMIQARVPAGAPVGSQPIFVSVGGVPTASANDFTVIGPGPFINGFSPQIGSAGADVTITGAHFTSGMTVRFNGVASVTNASSSTSFTVKVPAGATSGLISVSNSLGVWTSVSNFLVPPTITGFSPTSGRTGTNIVITGNNFLGATLVQFNSTNATSFTILSNTAIQATAPAGVTTGLLRVTTPAGTAFSASNFVVQPTVTTFSPTFGPPGTRVTVNGANFIGSPSVKFNGVNGTGVSVTNSTLLGATVPSTATTGPITVITTDGTNTSLTLFYLPPFIKSFSPTNSAPGTTVTLLGTNFTDTSSLKFNGVTASFFNVSSNSLQATVPSGFTTGPLTIITPGGTNSTSSIAQSNFYAAPIITSFTPQHGLPGTNVALLGTNFLGTLSVTFNGVPGTGLVVSNNNSARITVPASATTGPLALTAPAGTFTTAPNFFLDYTPALSISTAAPPLLTLSWPITFFPYALQTNADLTVTSAWSNVLSAPIVVGGSNVVTETNLGGTLFYRLKR